MAVPYMSTAALLIVFDFGSGVLSSNGLSELGSVSALFLLAAILSLCGVYPPFFELLYTAVFLTSAYLELLQPLVSPIIGIYVLVGAWLVRSWIIPGVLLLLVTEISLIVVSPHPALQAAGALVGSSVTITIGLATRSQKLKTAEATALAEFNRRNRIPGNQNALYQEHRPRNRRE
ncbi:hypothetical protein [Mobiluncus mulieris]|uniref:hypothetical protein n=1 Tax=Mobiluncus mulieris TaxID=2052 RepID=UPI0021E32C63|nr:hypothetical protein [Mobiluncus mulieris]MCV0002417.1 hypothetical protein [Mobiluncus mulieris]